MNIFKYKVKNVNGQIISGLVEAKNENEALDLLKEKGYAVISLEKRKTEKKGSLSFFSGVKPKDLVVFFRQFSVLISASVPLVQALKILVDQTDSSKMRTVLLEIANDVDEGTKLSEALGKKKDIFSGFYVNVIKSGETSGKLDEVLNYLADEAEKDYDMMSKIRGAMIYPIFVFSGLGVVGIMMMIFIVPKLTEILSETGGQLPLPTRMLIALSDFLNNYWMILVILLVGLVIGGRFFLKTDAGKKFQGNAIIRLPVFGKLFQKIYLVRFTRSLQTLIFGGVSIAKALSITADVVSNDVYKKLIEKTKQEVEDGNSISSVFAESKEVPKMVSQMMSIGEQTGRLDMVLSRITNFYAREIDNMIANLMSLMEPIIMVILGLAVGVMIAAIIMPMYNMATQV